MNTIIRDAGDDDVLVCNAGDGSGGVGVGFYAAAIFRIGDCRVGEYNVGHYIVRFSADGANAQVAVYIVSWCLINGKKLGKKVRSLTAHQNKSSP